MVIGCLKRGRHAGAMHLEGALLLYTAVELRTGVFAGEETPVLNQSEV
jgi:hypothetical protein